MFSGPGFTIFKRIIESILSPTGIMVLLFFGGLLLSVWRRRSKTGHRLLILGASVYLFLTFAPIAEIAIGNLERQYPPLLKPDGRTKIEHVAVLASYGEEHLATPVTSNLSGETVCRITEGIRIYRQLAGARLILSGGTLRDGDKPIGRIMSDFVKEMGVPEQDIHVEGRSRTTYENLVEVRKILGEKPFILVTSARDLPRAMSVAHKLGMSPIAAPACIRTLQHYPPGMNWSSWSIKILAGFGDPSHDRLTELQWAYHEYLGYVWYKFSGQL